MTNNHWKIGTELPKPEERVARGVLAFVAVLLVINFGAQLARAQAYKENILYSFNGPPDGFYPDSSLLRNASGDLYGVTDWGGSNSMCLYLDETGCGIVFKINGKGEETVLHVFSGPDGAQPAGEGLVRDAIGNFYGATFWGGNIGCSVVGLGCGTVFKLDTAGNESVLYSLAGGTAGAGAEAVVRDTAGNLYGAALWGGYLGKNCSPGQGCGVVFKVDRNGKETVLHKFGRKTTDGENPFDVVEDEDGNLYGTAIFGGNAGCGVVFEVTKTGKYKVLFNFSKNTGCYPQSVISYHAGVLYGTTYQGGDGVNCVGSLGCGVVYKLDTTGKETVLYSFAGGADGEFPDAGVVMDKAGTLYGSTYLGGAFGYGTLFMLTKNGTKMLLHSFMGSPNDGALPASSMVLDYAGNLYGTTYNGGAGSCYDGYMYGCGTVFKLSPQ